MSQPGCWVTLAMFQLDTVRSARSLRSPHLPEAPHLQGLRVSTPHKYTRILINANVQPERCSVDVRQMDAHYRNAPHIPAGGVGVVQPDVGASFSPIQLDTGACLSQSVGRLSARSWGRLSARSWGISQCINVRASLSPIVGQLSARRRGERGDGGHLECVHLSCLLKCLFYFPIYDFPMCNCPTHRPMYLDQSDQYSRLEFGCMHLRHSLATVVA